MKQRKYYKRRVKIVIVVLTILSIVYSSWLMWLKFLGNVPIRFWGQVVDHQGEAIEGVKIRYRVGKPRMLWDSNTEVKNIYTDVNGEFYIRDKGDGFSFESFEKEGYRKTEGQKISFAYGERQDFVPDKLTPKIYTLIKQDEIEGLIKSSQALRLNWDGLPVYYSIKTGRLGETGEVKITANRGAVIGEYREARYDWSFKLEVPQGGLLETTRSTAYLAPEKGYNSSWEVGSKLSDSSWVSGKKGDTFFFFKLANGKYGKLQINFSSKPGKSSVCGHITSYLNPSGGHVLEYDGSLKIKQ